MTNGVLDFYFDFISPYAYLAWRNPRNGPRAVAARHGMTLRVRPIFFAAILDKLGQLGPAEIPSKRAFTIKDVLRHAAVEAIPMTFAVSHPFNPLALLRLALPEVCGEKQAEVIDALFVAVWGDGKDVQSKDMLHEALTGAGLDADTLLARAAEDDVKATLRRETEEAMAQGVFGVPTFMARGELFWGSDRVADLERFLEGRDPLDQALAASIVARPLTMTRPGSRR